MFEVNESYIKVPQVTTTERNALTPANGMVVYDTTANSFYKYENGAWSTFAGGSGAAWGSITGTLSNQTDLQSALDAKLNIDGSNANSDIDVGAYKINAQSFGVKGVNGAGHVGLKHQASNATASANETSLFAGSDGELYYKNDGNSVVQIATRAWVTAQGYITNVVTSLGYTPENSANKTDTISGNTASSTKYLSAKGVYDWVISLGYQAALTAANFGSFINGLTSKTTPVDADYIPLMDSADSNATKKISWANLKAGLKRNVLYCRNDTTLATTANTEVIMDVYAIPANTLLTYDTLIILAGARMVRTAGTWTFNIGISSSSQTVGNAPTSGTTIGFYSGTSNRNGYLQHIYKITGSTTLDYVGAGNTDANYIGLNTTTSGNSTTIDRTGIIYVYVSMTMGTSGDTGTLKDFVIERIKGG